MHIEIHIQINSHNLNAQLALFCSKQDTLHCASWAVPSMQRATAAKSPSPAVGSEAWSCSTIQAGDRLLELSAIGQDWFPILVFLFICAWFA